MDVSDALVNNTHVYMKLCIYACVWFAFILWLPVMACSTISLELSSTFYHAGHILDHKLSYETKSDGMGWVAELVTMENALYVF